MTPFFLVFGDKWEMLVNNDNHKNSRDLDTVIQDSVLSLKVLKEKIQMLCVYFLYLNLFKYEITLVIWWLVRVT